MIDDPTTAVRGLISMSLAITANADQWFAVARASRNSDILRAVANAIHAMSTVQSLANHELLAQAEPAPDDATERIQTASVGD